jgi:hypothetical protein
MPTTARQLITKSFYLSGIVSRDLQTVSGSKLLDGLDLLNSILSFKTVDNGKIPYFIEYNFNTVTGQEKYFIPGLVSCETLTWLLNTNVRMPMQSKERVAYFGIPRVQDITSLPYCYHIEKCLGGSNLFIYFIPNQIYPFTMYGKFSLEEVEDADTDLELTFDKFFIEYIRYLLASYICEFYEIDVPSAIFRRLSEYESQMKDRSPIDFSMKKRSTLGTRNCPDIYGIANLGNGWGPY